MDDLTPSLVEIKFPPLIPEHFSYRTVGEPLEVTHPTAGVKDHLPTGRLVLCYFSTAKESEAYQRVLTDHFPRMSTHTPSTEEEIVAVHYLSNIWRYIGSKEVSEARARSWQEFDPVKNDNPIRSLEHRLLEIKRKDLLNESPWPYDEVKRLFVEYMAELEIQTS